MQCFVTTSLLLSCTVQGVEGLVVTLGIKGFKSPATIPVGALEASGLSKDAQTRDGLYVLQRLLLVCASIELAQSRGRQQPSTVESYTMSASRVREFLCGEYK
jgi:hypothetical protein